MAASIFESLLSTVDSHSIGEVANAIGQPAQTVAKGMKTTIAALLSGLVAKSGDPGALRGIIDLVAGTAGQLSWPQAASILADPNSPLMTVGKRLLPTLFGDTENAVASGISQASGLPVWASSNLLTVVAPMVMSYLANYMRVTGMNINGLGSILQRESATFRKALPSGLREIFQPETTAEAPTPVIAQATRRQTSSAWILPALAIAGLALGLIWLGNRTHRAEKVEQASPSIGKANRANLTCTLPAGVNIPVSRVESRLLAFVQDPNTNPAGAWFTTDQLSFATGSAKILPESQAELKDIAVILTNCPKVRMTVAVFTDNVGGPDTNLRLSRSRADAIVADLVEKGVASDHLAAEGLGEQNSIGDNTTAAGRAQNRRVAIHVTQK
jgi:outer membrane protein OmpA-like peptidoglycan-associated protein